MELTRVQTIILSQHNQNRRKKVYKEHIY